MIIIVIISLFSSAYVSYSTGFEVSGKLVTLRNMFSCLCVEVVLSSHMVLFNKVEVPQAPAISMK